MTPGRVAYEMWRAAHNCPISGYVPPAPWTRLPAYAKRVWEAIAAAVLAERWDRETRKRAKAA